MYYLEIYLQIHVGANFSLWSIHVLLCLFFHWIIIFITFSFKKISIVTWSALPNHNDHVGIFPNRFAVILEVWGVTLSLTSLAVFPRHVILLWILAFVHE